MRQFSRTDLPCNRRIEIPIASRTITVQVGEEVIIDELVKTKSARCEKTLGHKGSCWGGTSMLVESDA